MIIFQSRQTYWLFPSYCALRITTQREWPTQSAFGETNFPLYNLERLSLISIQIGFMASEACDNDFKGKGLSSIDSCRFFNVL